MKNIKYQVFSLIASFVLIGSNLSAQIEECDTEPPVESEYTAYPWYGNDEFLPHYYDSLANIYGNPTSYNKSRDTSNDIEGLPNVWLRIPVQFWIYRVFPNDPGRENVPNERNIKLMVDALNNDFRNNSIPIRFYVRCIEYINDPNALDVDGNEGRQLCNTRGVSDAVDVHIVDIFRKNSGEESGGRYYSAPNAIVIPRAVPLGSFVTFTHEIGHYFGLLHTFEFYGVPCLWEPVSRGLVTGLPMCPFYVLPLPLASMTGDFLRDTPADPNMSKRGSFNSSNCTFTTNEKDWRFDSYSPDTRNFMAYGNGGCRSNFTRRQRELIVHKAVVTHNMSAKISD